MIIKNKSNSMFFKKSQIHSKIFKKRKRERGFSVAWLSTFLLFITMTITISLTTDLFLLQNKHEITHKHMVIIEKAMAAYLMEVNRLPCPAGINISYTEDNVDVGGIRYGRELFDPATGYCVETGNEGIASGNDVYMGAIPSEALRIPNRYTLDGWGNKIMYAIDKFHVVKYGTEGRICGWLDSEVNANIQIDSSVATNVKNNIIFALISNGSNELGAYGGFDKRQNILPTNQFELDNVFNITGIDNVFNINAGDDIIRYHDPDQKQSLINMFNNQFGI